MNGTKRLAFEAVKGRIEHHIEQLGIKLELGTARVDLEPHVELLDLLLERARALCGGTQETAAWGQAISELRSRVEGRPHLQLVR